MTRLLQNKELVNTRLENNYASWIYCTKCNKTIGYLYYITYDRLNLKYECNCGSKGSAILDFEDTKNGRLSNKQLLNKENRLCCPEDEAPLITILSENLKKYEIEIICRNCNNKYIINQE